MWVAGVINEILKIILSIKVWMCSVSCILIVKAKQRLKNKNKK